MSWNTKRDGYYTSSYNRDSLGSPVAKLEPQAGHTHAITVPGTAFQLFLNADKTDANKLLKQLAKTTVKGNGSKRVKATPVLQTIAEFQASQTVKAA